MQLKISLLFVATVTSVHTTIATERVGNDRRRLRNSTRDGKNTDSHESGVREMTSDSNHEAGVVTHEKRQKETRIIGGTEASEGEYPYYADWFGCGGSLIAPDIVLSAAHCNGPEPNIIVGAYRAGKETNGAVGRTIIKKAKHPRYKQDGIRSNDFILLKLSEPVYNLKPVLLNFDENIPKGGDPLTVIGLGLTVAEVEGTEPDILREVDVQYVPTAQCNGANGYDGDIVDDFMFCAGVPGGGEDSCHGDSGGPIIVKNGDQHTQVGVVSWGIGCAEENYPGVYARISGAGDWIKSKACEMSDTNPTFCGGGGPSPTNPPITTPTQPPVASPTNAPVDCVPVTVIFHTDKFPQDNDFFLVDDATDLIYLEEDSFAKKQQYRWDVCVDKDACVVFDFWDEYGDGLKKPGRLRLLYNGEQVYSGRKFGKGIVEYMGPGCPY